MIKLAKLNCWEFKKCGREQGGILSAELGVCHAATVKRKEEEGENFIETAVVRKKSR